MTLRRSRHTGPDEATRELVWARAGGACEICSTPLHNQIRSLHHRRRRGMGGSRAPWINSPANLMLLCGSGTLGCHGMVEHNRAVGYDSGWLLRDGELPAETPVEVTVLGRVLLTDDGTYEDVAA